MSEVREEEHIVIRQGKRGPFMSCSGFPKCRATLPAERLEEFKKSFADGKGWPEDIRAKFGGNFGKADQAPATLAPAKSKAKAPAKKAAAKTGVAKTAAAKAATAKPKKAKAAEGEAADVPF